MLFLRMWAWSDPTNFKGLSFATSACEQLELGQPHGPCVCILQSAIDIHQQDKARTLSIHDKRVSLLTSLSI